MTIPLNINIQEKSLVSRIALWSRVVVVFVAILNYVNWQTSHPSLTEFHQISYVLFALILGMQIFIKSGASTSRVFREILLENVLITIGVVLNPVNYAFFILYYIVLYRCGRSLSLAPALIGVSFTACFQLTGVIVWGGLHYVPWAHVLQYIYRFAFALPGWMLVFGAGWMLRIQTEAWEHTQALLVENQKQKEALEQAHAELFKYALEVEEVSVLRERNRLAGEIHDTVGHALTSVIRSADACVELLNDPSDVMRVARHLQAMRRIAQESLTEVRHSVRALASETSWVDDWEVVLERFSKHVYELANTKVSIEGMLKIPIIERYTVYQCIKEAVTNSIRHGRASEIKVLQTDSGKSRYRIEISDNGVGTDLIQPGFGLQSIETRMHNIGGHALFRSTVGEGFYVSLWKGDESDE